MTETQAGAPDGIHVTKYEEGKVYEIPEALAKIFVDEVGCAVRYVEGEPMEMKSEKAAPHNKAMDEVPEDKDEGKGRPGDEERDEETKTDEPKDEETEDKKDKKKSMKRKK